MRRYALVWASALFLLVFAYIVILQPVLSPFVALPKLPGGHSSSTSIFLLFSLFHAWYALGWRHTLIFFVFSASISWAFEQVGVATGAIYGPYHYTDVLGIKLGHVPILIPLAWFMMIYPSYVIANLIADGQPTGTRGNLIRTMWLALLGAMVMTAWDLVMDPFMSGGRMEAWVWERGGDYFGVPLQNFVGWVLTTFTVYLAYRLFERRTKPRPLGPLTPAVAALPVLAYSAMWVAYVISAEAGPLRVIAAFAMGLPTLAALGRLPE